MTQPPNAQRPSQGAAPLSRPGAGHAEHHAQGDGKDHGACCAEAHAHRDENVQAGCGANAHTHAEGNAQARCGAADHAHAHAHAHDASDGCQQAQGAGPAGHAASAGPALDCCDHGGHAHDSGNGRLFWLAGVAALGAEVAHWIQGEGAWLAPVLALLAILGCGLSTYRAGLAALVRLDLNMNALMTVAVTGAALIGQWPEAAMVMFLFTLAERIEARSLARAREAVRTLMAIAPDQVMVRQNDGSWTWQPVAAVAVGSLLRARPGERIALDGVIVEGLATLDQSPITGESLPVEKGPGEVVYAGSINTTTLLQYRSTSLANDSKLARIIAVVEGAQASKAPTQRFVDRFARIYTPVVFVLALAVAVVPPLMGLGDWLTWIYRALVLLVIACPCALVISTPVTIVSGLAAAARLGVLVKGGSFLELGRQLDWVALDKTGTLTHGRPALTDMLIWDGAALRAPASAVESDVWLLRAASLAALSDHPLSQALARQAVARGLSLAPVQDFRALSGLGTRGEIDGRAHSLGNAALMAASGVPEAQARSAMETLAQSGQSVVALAVEGQLGALFGLADTLRPGSREAIADLQRLGIRTLMLSGDNRHVAQRIAEQAGIEDARGEQLPEDKLAAVRALQARGAVVGMVGDGINDAPALAQADIGFAMGAAGSDTAMETADVAFMDDDLRKLPAFVALARRTSALLWQNIALALGIKLVFLGLAVAGEATMWMAVFADMGASLLVVFNGLRLLRPVAAPR